LLTSSQTGSTNAFSISGISGFNYTPGGTTSNDMTQTQSSQDALFTINGLPIDSSTNTVTTAINGVTLNLAQAASAATNTSGSSTVTVSPDPSQPEAAINKLVSSFNSLASLVSTDTAYDPTSNTSSVLTGNSEVKDMMNQMINTIISSLGGGTTSGSTGNLTSLSNIGLTIGSDGTLSFDTSKFETAFNANPTQVSNLFTRIGTGDISTANNTQGFGVQLTNQLNDMLSPNGMIPSAISSMTTNYNDLQTQAKNWDSWLVQEQTNLTQQYSALNATLASMQSEQSALASALSALG